MTTYYLMEQQGYPGFDILDGSEYGPSMIELLEETCAAMGSYEHCVAVASKCIDAALAARHEEEEVLIA